MKRTIKYIIQIFLDVERPSGLVLQKEWVKRRILLFNHWTLRSILRQTFQDFEIWLICGRRHRDLTEDYPLDPRVRRIYPVGDNIIGSTFLSNPLLANVKPTLRIQEFEDLEEDFIVIARIDSDDMYDERALEFVADTAKAMISLHGDKERIRMVFRKYIYWDRINSYISFQNWDSPPFFVHIFPKETYKEWTVLRDLHFINHRFLNEKDDDPLELPKNLVCSIYHTQNISRIKRGHALTFYTKAQRRKFIRMKFKSTDKRAIMINTLKPFGVKPDET